MGNSQQKVVSLYPSPNKAKTPSSHHPPIPTKKSYRVPRIFKEEFLQRSKHAVFNNVVIYREG